MKDNMEPFIHKSWVCSSLDRKGGKCGGDIRLSHYVFCFRCLCYTSNRPHNHGVNVDTDSGWECKKCNGQHRNAHEYYKFCSFCGYPR